MKLICIQKDLTKSIGESQKAVDNKSTMDILRNLYLKTFGDSVKIIGYNLEISIESIFKANIYEEGEFLVDSKLFGDIIRKLPSSEIELSILEDNLHIKCEGSHFTIRCEKTDDFPKIPSINEGDFAELDQNEFKQSIKETVFCTSQDATKPVLMGELLEIKNNTINLVALDGYRLAKSSHYLSKEIEDKSLIVPSRTLQDLYYLLNNFSSNTENLKFACNKKFAIFTIGNTTITSRLIEGSFINYNNLLSNNYNSLVIANRKSLIQCIERASILSSDKNNLIRCSILEDNTLNISSSTDYGDCDENININLQGDSLKIAFNAKYLLEALKVMESENISLEFTTNINPCIIKPISENKQKQLTHLILPVRLS